MRGLVPDVLTLCSAPIDAGMKEWIVREGEQGNRVLAIAKKKIEFKNVEAIRQNHQNIFIVLFSVRPEELRDK